MKSLIISLFFLSLAFATTEFLSSNGPGPAKKPLSPAPAAAAQSSAPSLLQKLSEEGPFKGKALCLVQKNKHSLIVKEPQLLAAAKARAKALKPAVSVQPCHAFLAGFVNGAVRRFAADLAKGKPVPLARVQRVQDLMKLLRNSVDSKPDAASKKIQALFKKLKAAPKGKKPDLKAFKELPALLTQKAKQFEGLAKKSKKFAQCWKAANKLINGKQCALRKK